MRIDFYLLTSNSYLSMQQFACRLLDKVYQQNEKVHVRCENEAAAKQFDMLLWTYDDIAFTPHQLYQPNVEAPIMISFENITPQSAMILFNLTENIPTDYQHFSRVIEFVIQTEPWKSKAREKYKIYKQLKHDITTHEMK